MTREEAIDILNDERIVIWTELDEEEIARKQNEAIDMAIEALKAKVDCDLVSREGISNWLSNMGHDILANAVMDTRRFPSADKSIGEWKPISDGPPQRVGSYLVTCKGEHGFVYTDYDFWTVADEFKYHHDNVIAWVPFLEPYKENK